MNANLSAASRTIAVLLLSLCICAFPGWSQDTGDQGTMTRGERAEIAVTVRDGSGQIISAPASVTLYKNGVPSEQRSTSHGRAFFIPRGLGEFMLEVEATGYRSAQKKVSLDVPVQAEVDVYLQRDSAATESTGVPGRPILAPKAQEALAKGTQALRAGKLDEAQKYLSAAVKLAPGNPDVLYMQGVLYMHERNWESAQTVLQKADQILPNQAGVLSVLGMAFCNQKKYEQAIPPLEKSIQLEPTSRWETDWALAKAYYYREEYEKALTLAKHAHDNARESIPQIELLLAQCLTAVGRYEESAQVLRDFLKTKPDGPDATTARRWLENLAAEGKVRK